MSDLAEILMLIDLHHEKNPEHGLNCACMDKYIQKIRQLTKSNLSTRAAQARIDYVIRMAVDNR